MEITAGNDLAGSLGFACEHQRIVGHRAEFARDGAFNVAERIKRGAKHLRHRAQRVGVLHTRIVLCVRRKNRAPREYPTESRGNFDLPRLSARVVNARIKERVRCLRGINRHRRSRDRCIKRVVEIVAKQRARRTHQMRAVE